MGTFILPWRSDLTLGFGCLTQLQSNTCPEATSVLSMLLVSAHCCTFAAFILPSRPTGVHVPYRTQILPPPCDVGLEVVGEEQNSSEFSQFSKICKENTKTSCDESLTYKTFCFLSGHPQGVFMLTVCRLSQVLCADFDITSCVAIFVALRQVENTSVQLCCFFSTVLMMFQYRSSETFFSSYIRTSVV